MAAIGCIEAYTPLKADNGVPHPALRHPPKRREASTGQERLVNTAEFVARPSRESYRRLRYRLLNALWQVSSIDRQRGCCRWRIDASASAKVIRNGDGVAYLGNVQRCGRVACPVCGAKIAHRRAEEISEGVIRHLRAGGGVATGVLTVSHGPGYRLKPMIDLLHDGWRAVNADKTVRRLKDSLGVVGYIRGFETTHGRNSWHPHLHHLVLTERPLSRRALKAFQKAMFRVWARECERRGYRLPQGAYNALERVRTPKAMARYVSKVSLGHELASGSRKDSKGRTPMSILHDFTRTGDADDLELWREYEQGVHRRQLLTWSRGLKQRLLVDVKSDEDIMSEDEGGTVVLEIAPGDWTELCTVPNAITRVFDLVEADRLEDARSFIAVAVEVVRRRRRERKGVELVSYTAGFA